MDNMSLFRVGLIGTIVSAICCLTPALVILLGVLGLSAWTGYLDVVLFSALLVFISTTVYALWRRARTT